MTREQYLAKRQQLMAQAKGFLDAGNIPQFDAVKGQAEELDNQYEAEATAQANFAALQGCAVVPAGLQNLSGMSDGIPGTGMGGAAPGDLYDTDEYKTAFMNFICRGAAIPEKFRNEAATTTTTNVPAMIPTTYRKEIVRELKERGVIFQQLRHMNIQGGMEIPIADLTPVATWVGEDASEDQAVDAENTISFKYHGLECKIAQTILVSVVTIEEFQSLFVELAVEAVMAAVEKGVFKGTGTKQMLGVCNDPRVTNVVTMTADEFVSYSGWKKKVFAKIKKRYQRGKFFMAQGTFEGYIDGMVDQNGQPVGRTTYGIAASPTYSFGGKPVETTEDDVLTPYDTAAADEVVAVYMNLKDYILNSNMVLTVVRWYDHDANKEKVKVILICDGKVADAAGVILIKKGA